MKLKNFLEISGISQRDLARQLQIDESMVSYMTSGDRTPGLRLALKIKKVTKGKVKPEDWEN